MKNSLVRKGLVLGIIILFIGAGIAPICNAYMDAELNYRINQQSGKDSSYATTIDITTIFTGKNWTWMFYNDADFYRAYDPLEDFAEEAYSGENLDVIVLQDKENGPAKMWYIDENHNKNLLKEMGEINMGDYETLRNFIEYGKDNFPAERYLLSVYDHGGGWTGACVDDTDGGWLTMDVIRKALTEMGGVEIILFTAPCLMGALESVYELRECVDVYVGSEEGSGYGHWFGTIEGICNILNNNPDLSNIEIGEQIIQLIENYTPWFESVTMSAIRTDKMEELASSLDIVAHDFINNFNESFGNVWSSYGNVQSFGGGYCIDTYDFAEGCLLVETNQTICQDLENVKNRVSEAVIAECHGNEHPDANGLTIYFPDPSKYSYDLKYDDPDYELDFSQDTSWDEFLIDYLYIVEPGIDQEQTEANIGFIVCRKFAWAQSFVPSYDELVKVKLRISRRGFILSNLVVSIRSKINGIDLTKISVPFTEIPKDSARWIEFDFENIEVAPGETYYIICRTLGGNRVINYYALLGSNNADSYPKGDVWIRWLIGRWQKWDPPVDVCFKTSYKANPINAPAITGPTSGNAGTEYEYTLNITYPNDEDVYYYIEWGDDTVTYWTGPYESGKEVTISHIWAKEGTYSLRSRARNIGGVVSEWGTLEVTMPKNKPLIFNFNIIDWLFERFPLLEVIISRIMNLLR